MNQTPEKYLGDFEPDPLLLADELLVPAVDGLARADGGDEVRDAVRRLFLVSYTLHIAAMSHHGTSGALLVAAKLRRMAEDRQLRPAVRELLMGLASAVAEFVADRMQPSA